MGASTPHGPLSGLRILEIGHFVAAPFCTRLLGDLGAEIIKIEPPGGDPVRGWGAQVDGKSLWWSIHGRNKKSVTLNIKVPESRAVLLRLAAKCDAVVENFRPGQLAKMGLGPDDFRTKAKADLVIAHISGFGQDGPYRDRAAFGVIGEAIGGLRYLTDHAPGVSDLPPVRAGVSIGDSLAGLYAAFGIMSALWQRDRVGGDQKGRVLDVALTDAVLSLMEGMLPEYGALGKIRQPTGSRISTAAPSSAYPSADRRWILIAANSEPLFSKLAALIGRPDLVGDSRYNSNQSRVQHAEELDAMISRWTVTLPMIELEKQLVAADIPCTQVYSAAECAADPQFRHRGMVREVNDPQFGPVLHSGIVPHFPEDPGSIRWAGPVAGAHTDTVLRELIGMQPEEIDALRRAGGI